MSDDSLGIKTELEDINENEVKYDSDGPGRGTSPGRPPSSSASVGSAGSGASSASGSRGRRRTWKKPKDKPKRPLSAYNIFFKHERSRIVEGREDNPSPQEIIRSIEQILSTSRETRRHRRTHGKISFGDLARKIAEKWKTVDKESKAVFEHYAELDTRRYRRELKLWKDRKEQQALSGSMHEKFNASISSLDGEVNDDNELSLDQLGPSNHSHGGHNSFGEAWGARYSMNSSFSSIDSTEVSLEPIPINDMSRTPLGRSQHSTTSGTLSGSGSGGSFPSLGMEVGVPIQGGGVNNVNGGGVVSAFSQLNVGGNNMQANLSNMQANMNNNMQNNMNVQGMQNMQPNDIALFNQQQQLLNNMQFGNMQNAAGQMGQQMGQQMGGQPMGQMGQQQQNQNLSPMDLQQQRRSLEEQRQQLLILQQQQQILQQQLIQQQNSLRMQQASLGQQQANFAQQQQMGGGMPNNNNNMGGGGGNNGDSMVGSMNVNNMNLSNVP